MNEVALDFSNRVAPPPRWVLTRGVLATLRGICIVHGPYAEMQCPGCFPKRALARAMRLKRRRRDPLGRMAIAEFCLRVAVKRFEKFQSTQIDGKPPVDLARSLRSGAPLFSQEKAAPTFSGKEKSALAKDPKEYAVKLQKLPDRIAAIVSKTVAVKGDAFEIDDDMALIRILDLINDLDHTLIERNSNKKLANKKLARRTS